MLGPPPSPIRIGLYDVKVEVSPDLKDEGEMCWGAYMGAEKKIFINESQLGAVGALETLLHEVSHAIYESSYLQPTSNEEQVVGAFGAAWTQIFFDNPKFLRWIQAATKCKKLKAANEARKSRHR